MANPRKMQVELVDLTKIQVHPRNQRKGDLATIKQGLETYDQYAPIVVQKTTGHVLVGNHRFMAAQELGWTKINVHWVDVADEEALRLLLFDNRASDKGTYDEEGLLSILRDLNGLEGTGYAESDVSDLARITGELGRQQSQFLDDLTGDGNDGGSQRPGHDDGRNYFQLSYPVTSEQRDVVLQALQHFRDENDHDTVVEALVGLCNQYLVDQGETTAITPAPADA